VKVTPASSSPAAPVNPRSVGPSAPVIPRSSGLAGRRGIRLAPSLLSVALALSAVLLPSTRSSRNRASPTGPALELGPGPDLSLFARATKVQPFILPRDHGPHFEYQTEWWYYTGNVVAEGGRRFGFQLTFFRRGLSPGPPPDGPGLASNQVYFAHFAITDVAAGRHAAVERFSRGAAGLAGAAGVPFSVWLEGWKVDGLNSDGSAVRLVASDEASGLLLDLELRAAKPLVAHGDRGLSPKSDDPGNASYYVGYTRLSARGRVSAPDLAAGSPGPRELVVSGEAWFDHEWSTSALGPGAVGWDWFSLQLADRREVMLFQLRRENGEVGGVSGGTLVEADGRARQLGREVRIEVLAHWTSPETGVRYPSRWRVVIPAAGLDVQVEPWLEAQEVRASFVYWEGAVRVSGTSSQASEPDGPGQTDPSGTLGHGYVELTGYASSMQGVF
jgi:predicted secreted hydrolase